jgi:hypothetical protein
MRRKGEKAHNNNKDKGKVKKMELKELMDKAAAHVVKMLEGTDGEKWEADAPMYEGVCGWCGVMAPMNRPAFVAKFGEDFTKAAEEEAKRIMAARTNFWENSKAKGYEAQADNAESNNPASFEVGGFVWGVMDTLKCDHEDFRRVVRHLIKEKAESKSGVLESRLCKIIRIEEVEDIERDAATILKGWQPKEEHEGGCGSDDVSDEEFGEWGQNYSRLTKEQKRTFYTLAVLVRDSKGKYFLIDPEGYEYPRYVILPKRWEKMYEQTVAEIVAEIKAEEEAAAKAKAEKEAADRAAYDARCEKWAGMMEKIPEGLDHYNSEYRKIGKRNVLKMAKAAFPWVRFSVSYDGGWGTGYILKWKNGPTVDEVREAGDYGLFMPWWDTFDGMTDCADSESAKFTDFSNKFGGVGNGVKFEREECEKDQNGDPNGKPPAPSKPPKGNGGNGSDSVEVRENTAKGGLEIYFPAMPSEAIREFMKSRNWRWSKFSRCWWHKATDEARNTAAEVVAMWKKENERAAA